MLLKVPETSATSKSDSAEDGGQSGDSEEKDEGMIPCSLRATYVQKLNKSSSKTEDPLRSNPSVIETEDPSELFILDSEISQANLLYSSIMDKLESRADFRKPEEKKDEPESVTEATEGEKKESETKPEEEDKPYERPSFLCAPKKQNPDEVESGGNDFEHLAEEVEEALNAGKGPPEGEPKCEESETKAETKDL